MKNAMMVVNGLTGSDKFNVLYNYVYFNINKIF